MAIPLLVTVVPTLSASPDYSDGDVMGGVLTITLPKFSGPRILTSVSILSKVDLSVTVDLLLLNANPSASTTTDNGALSLHADDYDKVFDLVQFADSGWVDLGTPEIQVERDINLVVVPPFYGLLVARGTINLGSASDFTVHFGFLP